MNVPYSSVCCVSVHGLWWSETVECESVLIVCCGPVHGLRRSAYVVCDCTIIFRLLRKATECID